MTAALMRRKWQTFVVAFNALGDATHGMSPDGAAVLAQACVEFETDAKKGFRPLDTGTPPCAGGIIHILSEYAKCPTFWSVDMNFSRAQVTQAACDYVLSHQDVFALLNGLI